jgi:ankyrin repeat protein
MEAIDALLGGDLKRFHKHKRSFYSLLECSRGGHLNIVKYLVENGAVINPEIKIGSSLSTALKEASGNGKIKVVEYLVENGAIINTTYNSYLDTTPLMASLNKSIKIWP